MLKEQKTSRPCSVSCSRSRLSTDAGMLGGTARVRAPNVGTHERAAKEHEIEGVVGTGVVGTCSYTVRDARIRPDAHGEGCLMCAVRESHLRLSSLNAQSAALVLTSLGSTAYTFRVACEKACSRIMS